jgi:hypothetical protein
MGALLEAHGWRGAAPDDVYQILNKDCMSFSPLIDLGLSGNKIRAVVLLILKWQYSTAVEFV